MKLPDVVSRHRGPFVVALVVLGIAVAVFVTVRAGTGGDSSAGGGPPVTTTPGTGGRDALSGPAAELVRLLDRSTSVNFDATYSVTDTATGPSTVHLWRRPPLARIDTETGSGDGTRRRSEMVTPSGPVACSAQGAGQTTCVAKPGLSIGNVGVVPPTIVAQLAGLEVTGADDTIGGEAVRCFTLKPPAGAQGLTAELCVTSEGIPARVVAGSTRLDLASLARGRLPDSVFEPPAPVVG